MEGRELDPSLQSILDNARKPYGNSSYFAQSQPIERPRNTVRERGFSFNAERSDYLNYEQPQPQPRLIPRDASPPLDDFDRSILRGSYRQQGDAGQSRASIVPRGLNYASSNHELAMPELHSRPQLQPAPSAYASALHRENIPPQAPEGIVHDVARFNPLQKPMQQPSQNFNLGAFAFNPPNSQPILGRSSSPQNTSSPSTHLMQRRALHQSSMDNQKPAPIARMAREYRSQEEADQLPLTPTPQSSTIHRTPQAIALRHAPPLVQGIQLVSSRDLPDRFRQIFKYPVFNAVQSKCFPYVFQTNDNFVVAAPTGSGKTTILELAICKLVEGFDVNQVKIIYLAPTKALCSERAKDWENKFRSANLPCSLLTGDSEGSDVKTVAKSVIIVTTPEKWDSITRKWKDHGKLLQMVKLVLIDEVHILKDTRGATLEAIVSRMKSIGASIRFVALSATVPNSHDIATWLGRNHTNTELPAHRETFGEDFRPVKLQKHIHGFESGANEFAFDSILDSKLPALVGQYTHRKPMMVFCFTRKSCEKTAQVLAEWWQKCRDNDRAWPAPTQRLVTTNKDLNQLLTSGVAFHHGGLDTQDRSVIEKGFLEGQIHVICCTSTLAVGVNLPCHLVVIKNTVGYQDGGKLLEYSDLEVMQMLGRAGRPQFDDSAVAIIMTRTEKVDRYKKMVSGQEILESTLHLNLIEHLNSEIGLGTIHNVHTAKRWLSSTFLAVRMRQNPKYYKLDGIMETRDVDARLEQICERDINLLQEANLIHGDGRLSCTEYGEAMSRYMVQFETMKQLLSVPLHAKMSMILHILAQSPEFRDQLRMKPNERNAFRELNKSPLMKWPVKENITNTAHKVSIMIQAQLSGVELPSDKDVSVHRMQYMTEKRLVFEHMIRLLKCLIDCRAFDCDGITTRNALELARSMAAEYWENSPMQLRQIPNVGPVAVRKFIGANINSIDTLRNTEPGDIERILSKNPPYGRKLRDNLTDFPKLTLKAEFMRPKPRKPSEPVRMSVRAYLGVASRKATQFNGKQMTVTFIAEVSSGSLVNFWRGSLSMLERNVELKFDAVVSSAEEVITCTLACDELVGTIREVVLHPGLPPNAFPPPKQQAPTRKISATSNMGLKRVKSEDFGSDEIDDSDMIAAVSKAESSRRRNDEDDFEDIDMFGSPPPRASSKTVKQPERQPERMKNGKWKCNHECADGAPTKSGGICKHACCRDGLDKPRKPSAPKNKGHDEDKSAEKKLHDKDSSKIKKSSKSKLKVASEVDQEKQRNMPAEFVDLAGDQNSQKPSASYESIQRSQSSKPKSQKSLGPFIDYSSSSVERRAPEKKKAPAPEIFDEDNEFGSENSDDFDLPSPSQLLNERFEVVSPLPRPTTKSKAPRILTEFMDSDMGIESGTLGLQEPIVAEGLSVPKVQPKATKSFEAACFNFESFDQDDFDYPMEPPCISVTGPELHATPQDGGSSSLGKRASPEGIDEAPVTKVRRITREKEAVPEPAPTIVDFQAPVPAVEEGNDAAEASTINVNATNAEDGDWVTFINGGNEVKLKKRKGNSDVPLPDWVMQDMPPEFYEEYGDFVDFV